MSIVIVAKTPTITAADLLLLFRRRPVVVLHPVVGMILLVVVVVVGVGDTVGATARLVRRPRFLAVIPFPSLLPQAYSRATSLRRMRTPSTSIHPSRAEISSSSSSLVVVFCFLVAVAGLSSVAASRAVPKTANAEEIQ